MVDAWRNRRSHRNDHFYRANNTSPSQIMRLLAPLLGALIPSQETTNFSSPLFPSMCYPSIYYQLPAHCYTSRSHFPTKEQNIRQSRKPINEGSSWQTSNGTITPRSGLRFQLRVWEITATSENCQTSRNEKYEVNESFLGESDVPVSFSVVSDNSSHRDNIIR